MNKITVRVIVVLLIITGAIYLPKQFSKEVKCEQVTGDMTYNQGEAIRAKCNEMLELNSKLWDEQEQLKKPFIEQQAKLTAESEYIRDILQNSVFTQAPQHEQSKLSLNNQSQQLSKTKNLHLVK